MTAVDTVLRRPDRPDPVDRGGSEHRLITQTLAGDLRAFEQLVERHREIVFRVASAIVGSDYAEDVSQDAFLRAFHRLGRFRSESSFRTWLLTITKHAAFSQLDRLARDSPPSDAWADPVDHDGSRQPVSELERRERQHRLELKLARLRPEYRSLLMLRDLEGFSYDEIAEILEMPLGSVKGRLHRAREELITLLRNNSYDWELPA